MMQSRASHTFRGTSVDSEANGFMEYRSSGVMDDRSNVGDRNEGVFASHTVQISIHGSVNYIDVKF